MLTFSVTHSCHCEGNGGEGGGEVTKLMHRATEQRSFVHRGAVWRAWAVADGELLARATQVHAGTRAGSVCETAGKPGEGVGGGRLVSAGREVMRGAERVVPPCLFGLRGCSVFFLLSQIEFGSAHSFSLRRPFPTPPMSHRPAPHDGSKKTPKKQHK